jgi:hypothetical protein
MSAVYDALHAGARDEPWDGSALDRVFDAYRTSEHAFSTVFEDFRRLHKSNRLIRPSAWKLVNEVAAIAHRRRGTWA